MTTRFFSDREYGSRCSGLKSAINWRDNPALSVVLARSFTTLFRIIFLVVLLLWLPHLAGATNYRPDDDNGDGVGDRWGIPQWVAYEIKKLTVDHPLKKRPQAWITDEQLHAKGIAPDDPTYAVSGTKRLPEVKTDYRFVRGHMCPKDTAERVSADAAFNTHTILNAVPQLQWQNNGVWKKLEKLSLEWADKYGRIWVVAGPVFFDRNPAMWLGQASEVRAAIPDALFKIVIRQKGEGVGALAFLIPNILPKTEKSPERFLVSVDRVEEVTGLDFMSVLPEEIQVEVEANIPEEMDW